MSGLLGTLGTCFMIVATPIDSRPALVITGYSDLKLAREARDDIRWGGDAATRNADAEYRLTPAYAAEQARAAKERAEHPLPHYSISISAMSEGHVRVWSTVQIVAAPEQECRR
jgi:hypothetical protein